MSMGTYCVRVTASPSESILYLYEAGNKHIASYSYKKLRKHTLSQSVNKYLVRTLDVPKIVPSTRQTMMIRNRYGALPLWKAI